ncbi:hypothetical protein [Bacterioplanes sanyensis]|nr:hypothetical protein [Bacterioplanes sanyensis]
MEYQNLTRVKQYLMQVEAGVENYTELFDDDVQLFIPALGSCEGHGALMEFSQCLCQLLAASWKMVEELNYVVVDDVTVVVEVQDPAQQENDQQWLESEIKQGQFCSVFEFHGELISRVFVDLAVGSADPG